jgi:hypothetical protein
MVGVSLSEVSLMLAGAYNMVCEQGTTFVRDLALEYPDPGDPTGETFLPFDLTGYTARMQVRRTLESATTMLNLTTVATNGSQIIMQPSGESNAMRIYVSDEATALITTDGVYDLEIENESGEVSRVIEGDFVLVPEVTR